MKHCWCPYSGDRIPHEAGIWGCQQFGALSRGEKMSDMEPMGLRHEAETVFRRMEEEVYRLNNSKGWFEDDRTVGDMVALLHAEVSEILEAYRHWELKDATLPDARAKAAELRGAFAGVLPKPEGVGSEMADCLIRLLDMAKRWDIDLVAEYDRKMRFNWTRPYRHGRRNL